MPRPKGLPKTGGRTTGTPNRRTTQKAAEIAASGLTPLDYFLSVMRDETRDTDTRLEAAKLAAPFVHPRLSAIDATVNCFGRTFEEALAELE